MVMGLGPCWTRSGPAPFIRVWVLIFETHRIRVGSGFKKYLTGSGSISGPSLRCRCGLGLRPDLETQTLDSPLRQAHAFRQVFGF